MIAFDEFWNLYDKKVGRKKCIQKWKRLKECDKYLIMEHLPYYIESTPNKQYRKNPETYLNGECWHDEVIFYEHVKKIQVNDAKTVQSNFLKERYGIT
jgi:hypothetical protein